MADRFFERHQDNVIDINGMVGTLTAGQQYTGLQLTLDADAPFIMRGLAARMQWDVTTGQTNLKYVFIRWKRANGDFIASNGQWIPLLEWTGSYGLGGNPYPMWPEEEYPGSGVIEVDVWNNNSAAVSLAGVQLVARGVKRYAPRQSMYPAKFRGRNFTRSVKVAAVPKQTTGGYPSSVSQQGSIPSGASYGLQYTVSPQGANGNPGWTEAPFVLRKLQAGCLYQAASPFFRARNVWITLRDQDGHPYSNLPVDWNIVAGCGWAGYPTGGFPDQEQTGPHHPGLLYSEIWIPANAPFLIDIVRDDTPYNGQAGLGAQRLDFALGGMKVYPA